MEIIGRNPVIELLRSSYPVREILLQSEIKQDVKIGEIETLARQRGVKIRQASKADLDKLAKQEPHQGVIGFADIQVASISDEVLANNPGTYIYIREAQYEHNVGAIIRTAEVAGLAGVIIPPKQEITPIIVRISMGAFFHMPIYQGSLFPTIKLFKQAGMLVTAIERNEHTTIYDANLREDSLIIIGGEDKSISDEVQNKCDQVVGIPQFGKVNSLNMSVAAAIAIFEHVRQREGLK